MYALCRFLSIFYFHETTIKPSIQNISMIICYVTLSYRKLNASERWQIDSIIHRSEEEQRESRIGYCCRCVWSMDFRMVFFFLKRFISVCLITYGIKSKKKVENVVGFCHCSMATTSSDHFPHLIPINLFLSFRTVNKLFNLRIRFRSIRFTDISPHAQDSISICHLCCKALHRM